MNIVSNHPLQENKFSDGDLRSQSPEQQASPRLSHWQLSAMLIAMCAVPIITISILWTMLPPVYEGKLNASVYTEGLPSQAFYDVPYQQRPPFEGGFLVVQNNSDEPWTQLNIQINKYYQIYDTAPIEPGAEARFQVDKFYLKSGELFNPRYNQLESVRVYARLPSSERATFYHEF